MIPLHPKDGHSCYVFKALPSLLVRKYSSKCALSSHKLVINEFDFHIRNRSIGLAVFSHSPEKKKRIIFTLTHEAPGTNKCPAGQQRDCQRLPRHHAQVAIRTCSRRRRDWPIFLSKVAFWLYLFESPTSKTTGHK